MAKKTIREVIQSVKPGKIKSLSLNGIEVDGFRAEATRLSNRAREEGLSFRMINLSIQSR